MKSKKNVFIPLFCTFFFFLYFGCVSAISIPKQSIASLPEYEKKLLDCRIITGETQVTVDYVKQNDIADQITQIADILLNSEQANNGTNTFVLNISVRQRSFLHDIQQRNSIYIIASLKDKDGNVALNQTINIEGSDSILSSVNQYKYVKRILQNIKNIRKKAAAEKKRYEKTEK